MKTIRFRLLIPGVLTFLAMAAAAAAQDSSALLSSLEVRQHISSAQPADHASLRDHFVALADRYTADAARHTAMATAYVGNPNRGSATSPAAHCRRLAELATESAATVRQLAAHHERLAAGIPSEVPEDSARFEAGEGAPEPTNSELRKLAASARTPADHRDLEEYFVTLAARRAAEADEHTAMARAYRGNANRRGGDPAVNCDRMVKLSREAAEEARGAAAEHGRWATIG
jgi:hypothetical protein